MNLSDAILLGSLTTKPLAGKMHAHLDGVEYGCALGMAENAIGEPGKGRVLARWPWLQEIFCYPCTCEPKGAGIDIVVHLFDYHVMGHCMWLTPTTPTVVQKVEWDDSGCATVVSSEYLRPRQAIWTLEEVVSWVRSMEPYETVPEMVQKIMDTKYSIEWNKFSLAAALAVKGV